MVRSAMAMMSRSTASKPAATPSVPKVSDDQCNPRIAPASEPPDTVESLSITDNSPNSLSRRSAPRWYSIAR